MAGWIIQEFKNWDCKNIRKCPPPHGKASNPCCDWQIINLLTNEGTKFGFLDVSALTSLRANIRE